MSSLTDDYGECIVEQTTKSLDVSLEEFSEKSSKEPIKKPRSKYQRDPCVCCGNMKDMLRHEPNNRICDICNKGPICWSCYAARDDNYLAFCICENCKDEPIPEMAKLTLENHTYVPRFYKPNIQRLCICDEFFAIAQCVDCSEKLCEEECLGECETCGVRICPSCAEWGNDECARCGLEGFDKTKREEGTEFVYWKDTNFNEWFTGRFITAEYYKQHKFYEK